MSSGKVSLQYFDLRARGEILRLVFSAAKIPFEDSRIQFADWPKLKPNTPYGTLPVIEIKGNKYSQSLALATYYARENGLYGSSNLEGLKIDMIQQLREDLLGVEGKGFGEQDAAKKAEIGNELATNVYPRYLKYFNDILKANGNGWSVGSKLSLADIVIFEGTESIQQTNRELIDQFPEVKALRAKVAKVDGIRQYVQSRKVQGF
ncbi:S-crystallin SL11 [Aplysia californica]|uniref:S-crystallin SL11 n=1 Tax=Aplysia californica TaxID=6500 RepID=A0ABM0JJG2_APLCA|nr:S-crystallin SL11 [Aplysia californica]